MTLSKKQLDAIKLSKLVDQIEGKTPPSAAQDARKRLFEQVVPPIDPTIVKAVRIERELKERVQLLHDEWSKVQAQAEAMVKNGEIEEHLAMIADKAAILQRCFQCGCSYTEDMKEQAKLYEDKPGTILLCRGCGIAVRDRAIGGLPWADTQAAREAWDKRAN